MKTSHELFGMEIGEGWLPLVEELKDKLSRSGWKGEFTQVKEKWGLLRVYISEGNEERWKLIDEYETRSGTICEVCGEEGKRRSGSWIKTLCDKHNIY